MGQNSESFHCNDFELRDREPYYKGNIRPLTSRGKLKAVGAIANILKKEGLCKLGFNIPKDKLTARQAVMLNRVEEELPSMSDIAKADDIELQEITENALRSMENALRSMKKNLISQFECIEKHGESHFAIRG